MEMFKIHRKIMRENYPLYDVTLHRTKTLKLLSSKLFTMFLLHNKACINMVTICAKVYNSTVLQ